jgi:copper resistance protein B
VTGLALLRFEFSPTLFVSHRDDVSTRLAAEYQMLITQRLVAMPEVELNVALRDVPEWGVGSSFNDVELGLRLRYESIREFAPYVGVACLRRVGDTAGLARDH